MSLLFAWWWLAAPILLLPIWWHRQRRQQNTATTLATARFLPSADPRLQTIWRWRDYFLLALRLCILLCLLALLAGLLYRGRSDTVFVSKRVESAWIQQQLQAPKQGLKETWSQAPRLTFCGDVSCDIQTNDIWQWLALHQHEWKAGAQWLMLASADELRLPANAVAFRQSLELKVAPWSEVQKLNPKIIPVLIKSARFAEWQTWFKVFEQSLDGRLEFRLSETWNKERSAMPDLIIWESRLAPSQEWHAPLWWVSEPAAFSDKTLRQDQSSLLKNLPIKVYDSPQGRIWLKQETKDQLDWPLHDLNAAKSLFEAWRRVQTQREILPAHSFSLAAASVPNTSSTLDDDLRKQQKPNLDHYLILALLGLYCLERMVNHARRT